MTRRRRQVAGARWWFLGMVLAVTALGGSGAVADGPTGPEAIDPDVKMYLEKMGNLLAEVDEFAFTADVTTNEMMFDAFRIHTTERVEAVVRRPDRLWVDTDGDTQNKRMWFDGKTVTMLSIDEMFYATTEGAKTIDKTLDSVMEQYSITSDVVDFLFSDPYDVLIENVTGGVYAGLHTVDGVDCHHLVFSQETLDWQIWIEGGSRSLPRKFAVTYKDEPGMPEVVTIFREWDLSTRHPDWLFEFDAPSNARQIEFLPVTRN